MKSNALHVDVYMQCFLEEQSLDYLVISIYPGFFVVFVLLLRLNRL